MSDEDFFAEAPGQQISDDDAELRRFPIILLIDVSGSMGQTNPNGRTDIDELNQAIPVVFDDLRNPPADSELYGQNDTIDVAIIAYSDTPELILPWTSADTLPAPPILSARLGTHTGDAFLAAYRYARQRLKYYRSRNVEANKPQIFHLTDGWPTDMNPGDSKWNDIIRLLQEISQQDAPPYSSIAHFTTSGADLKNEHGVTGRQQLMEFSGQPTVFNLDDNTDRFHVLAKAVKQTALIMTTTGGGDVADILNKYKIADLGGGDQSSQRFSDG